MKNLFQVIDKNGDVLVSGDYFASREAAQQFIDDSGVKDLTIKKIFKVYKVLLFNYRGEDYTDSTFDNYADAKKHANALDEEYLIICDYSDKPWKPQIEMTNTEFKAFIDNVVGDADTDFGSFIKNLTTNADKMNNIKLV